MNNLFSKKDNIEVYENDFFETNIFHNIIADEFEAKWLMKKYSIEMNQVLALKKYLLEAGEYTYPESTLKERFSCKG